MRWAGVDCRGEALSAKSPGITDFVEHPCPIFSLLKLGCAQWCELFEGKATIRKRFDGARDAGDLYV